MDKYFEQFILAVLLGVILAAFLEVNRVLPLLKPSLDSITQSKVNGDF